PIGGMEALLVELVRRMDRVRFSPELCCLKYLDAWGEMLADEVPAFTGLLRHKYDFRVLPRLTNLMRQRRIDAVVTVGTGGDKMFWGRLCARLAGVPVICSALHSTGLPDRVERLNRLLAPITDAFIGVAEPHGRYLAEHEGCPAAKVRIIPNGVDTDRFRPRWPNEKLRREIGLPPNAPMIGIVAALRPEKDHELFLQVAALVHRRNPAVHFLVVGDGVLRGHLEDLAGRLGIAAHVHFLGSRSDVPELLSLFDVFMLSSKMEANPVSILEAMACEKPVVAPRVGSIPETVVDGTTGWLVDPGDTQAFAARLTDLLVDPEHAARFGRAGREEVLARWSIAHMVAGYEDLITELYRSKCALARPAARAAAIASEPADARSLG
ncbi:MAG: glycosyltransferase, partial [Planctomycetota bacterium]